MYLSLTSHTSSNLRLYQCCWSNSEATTPSTDWILRSITYVVWCKTSEPAERELTLSRWTVPLLGWGCVVQCLYCDSQDVFTQKDISFTVLRNVCAIWTNHQMLWQPANSLIKPRANSHWDMYLCLWTIAVHAWRLWKSMKLQFRKITCGDRPPQSPVEISSLPVTESQSCYQMRHSSFQTHFCHIFILQGVCYCYQWC